MGFVLFVYLDMEKQEAEKHIDFITRFVVDRWNGSEMALESAAQCMTEYIQENQDLLEFHEFVSGSHLAGHFHSEHLKEDVNKLLIYLRQYNK